MVGYRRNFVAGGTFFFTVALQDRTSGYLVDHKDLLSHCFQTVKSTSYFDDVATVILPDHLHTIWKLPSDDFDYPARWKAIKSLFTRSLVKSGVPLTKNTRGEYSIWQRRYWEHTIVDEWDLMTHIDYIHYNPVKHGYVDNVSAWAHSSFHRYVYEGKLSDDWSGTVKEIDGMTFGE